MKPSDYNLHDFCGSKMKCGEAEEVARNIMLLLKAANDEFKPFTWKQYKKFCTHNVTKNELKVIELFEFGGRYGTAREGRTYIPGGMLVRQGNKFAVTNRFLQYLDMFRKNGVELDPATRSKVEAWMDKEAVT